MAAKFWIFLLSVTTVTALSIVDSLDYCIDDGCEKGWKRFERPNGGWCLKLFNEANISKSEAEDKCQAVGATLSGLQDQRETSFIVYSTTTHYPQLSGQFWIGAKRREPCMSVGQTKACNLLTSFEWTDNSTTGVDGFLWSARQPDNGKKVQSCVILGISKSAYMDYLQAGGLDDVSCENNNDAYPLKQMGYLCGKKAKF